MAHGPTLPGGSSGGDDGGIIDTVGRWWDNLGGDPAESGGVDDGPTTTDPPPGPPRKNDGTGNNGVDLSGIRDRLSDLESGLSDVRSGLQDISLSALPKSVRDLASVSDILVAFARNPFAFIVGVLLVAVFDIFIVATVFGVSLITYAFGVPTEGTVVATEFFGTFSIADFLGNCERGGVCDIFSLVDIPAFVLDQVTLAAFGPDAATVGALNAIPHAVATLAEQNFGISGPLVGVAVWGLQLGLIGIVLVRFTPLGGVFAVLRVFDPRRLVQ